MRSIIQFPSVGGGSVENAAELIGQDLVDVEFTTGGASGTAASFTLPSDLVDTDILLARFNSIFYDDTGAITDLAEWTFDMGSDDASVSLSADITSVDIFIGDSGGELKCSYNYRTAPGLGSEHYIGQWIPAVDMSDYAGFDFNFKYEGTTGLANIEHSTIFELYRIREYP